MNEDVLAACAKQVRREADASRSDQTRARLHQIADRIEAALRGDEPESPEPQIVAPDPASARGAAGEDVGE